MRQSPAGTRMACPPNRRGKAAITHHGVCLQETPFGLPRLLVFNGTLTRGAAGDGTSWGIEAPRQACFHQNAQGKDFSGCPRTAGMVQGWCRGAGPLTDTRTFQKPGLHATRGHPSRCFGSLCLTASASSRIRGKDVWPRVASSRSDAPPSNGICDE